MLGDAQPRTGSVAERGRERAPGAVPEPETLSVQPRLLCARVSRTKPDTP